MKRRGAGTSGRTDARYLEIEDLFIDARTLNCLRRADVKHLGDLTKKTRRELLAVRGWGRSTLREVEVVLEENGLRLFDSAAVLRGVLVARIADAGKRWWSTARAKANHARMSCAELDLWNAIRDLKDHDEEDTR